MKDLKKLWACLTAAILTCSFVYFGGACADNSTNSPNEPLQPSVPSEETSTVFEVYADMGLDDKPIANDYKATLTSDGEIEKVIRKRTAFKRRSEKCRCQGIDNGRRIPTDFGRKI